MACKMFRKTVKIRKPQYSTLLFRQIVFGLVDDKKISFFFILKKVKIVRESKKKNKSDKNN